MPRPSGVEWRSRPCARRDGIVVSGRLRTDECEGCLSTLWHFLLEGGAVLQLFLSAIENRGQQTLICD
jgi:hypothetical protein